MAPLGPEGRQGAQHQRQEPFQTGCLAAAAVRGLRQPPRALGHNRDGTSLCLTPVR